MNTLTNSMKPSTTTLKIITMATAFLLSAGAAWGETLGGGVVNIQEDSGNDLVVSGKTDEKGNATFKGLKAGSYSVALPNTAFFPVGSSVGTQRSVQVSITANGKTVVARPVPVTKTPAKAVVTDQVGKKIVIAIEKDGGTIDVNLTEGSTTTRETPTKR